MKLMSLLTRKAIPKEPEFVPPRCPKCPMHSVPNIRFIKDATRGERLSMQCPTCGYVWHTETEDKNKPTPRLEPWPKAAPQTK